MSTPANALNRPNPLLQTVARADFRTHAPLDSDSRQPGLHNAPVPGFRMVCQAICRVAGHGGPAWVEMLVRGTGQAASLSPMDVVRRGYGHAGLDFDLKVLDAALATAAALHPETRVGVNIRPCSLNQPGFIRALQAMLMRRRIAPNRLVLELVEFHGPVRLELAHRALRQLRRMQIMIALDDFGPGHPNLDVLAEGLVDFVKLDRSLVTCLDRSPGQTGVLQGIAALAASTGIALVAEGIETPAQMQALRQLGIDWMQGFLFGRPAPLVRRSKYAATASGCSTRVAEAAPALYPRTLSTEKEHNA